MATRVKGDSVEKGRRGVAKLVRLSPTRARLDFEKVEATKKYPEQPAVSYEIQVSFGEDGTIPDYVPFKLLKDNQALSLSATVDSEGRKILYAQPASGYFEARFDKFDTKGKDEPPTMETKKGPKNTYRAFGALLEITGGQWNGLNIKDGVWKGAKYWYGLYDNFAPNADGGLAVKGTGDGSNNLADFLDATVGGGEQVPFSENPLPELQKAAQAEDRRFFVNVAKGWVVSIVVPLSAMDEEIGDFPSEESTAEATEEIPEALKED